MLNFRSTCEIYSFLSPFPFKLFLYNIISKLLEEFCAENRRRTLHLRMAYSDDPTETELPKGVITLILPARMAQEYSRRSHMNP